MVGRILGLTSIVVMTACGGSPDATTASACGFAGLPKPASTPAQGASAKAKAEAAGLAVLDGFVRPYLLDHVTVYRGTFTAHDNQGVLGAGSPYARPGTYEDQYVPPSAAVASLVIHGGLAVLSVHSLTAHKYVELSQATGSGSGGITNVGIILPDDEQGGNTGTCQGCVPALDPSPDAIAFDGIESTQLVAIGPKDNPTLHTYGTAQLTRVPPCEIRFEDLAELNGGSGLAFVPQGDEMVAQIEGYAETANGYYCVVHYSLELYVKTANLADYGVRGYAVVPGQSCPGG